MLSKYLLLSLMQPITYSHHDWYEYIIGHHNDTSINISDTTTKAFYYLLFNHDVVQTFECKYVPRITLLGRCYY
jgi:hypothetical protein